MGTRAHLEPDACRPRDTGGCRNNHRPAVSNPAQMLATMTFSDAFDFVVPLLGVFLVFKRVAEMERYHMLRVMILTLILSFVVILLFIGYGLSGGNPIETDCVDGEVHFCHTEM